MGVAVIPDSDHRCDGMESWCCWCERDVQPMHCCTACDALDPAHIRLIRLQLAARQPVSAAALAVLVADLNAQTRPHPLTGAPR